MLYFAEYLSCVSASFWLATLKQITGIATDATQSYTALRLEPHHVRRVLTDCGLQALGGLHFGDIDILCQDLVGGAAMSYERLCRVARCGAAFMPGPYVAVRDGARAVDASCAAQKP